MKIGKTVGLCMFIGGLFLLILYGIYLGFGELMNALDLVSGLILGIIILGFLILLISIVIEQRSNTKTTMKDIKKEDLKP